MQKKHRRSYDEDTDYSYDLEQNGKRIKLDNLLQELSLEEDVSRKPTHSFIENKSSKQSQETDYVVNPSINLKSYSVFKKSSSPTAPTNSPNINSYVMERLVQHFNTIYNSKSALIQWYRPHLLLICHFEIWVLRLFNRFIRKYNKRFNVKPIRQFNFYSKIMNLINLEDVHFSYTDLLHILDQENKLEALKLKEKMNSRSYDIKNDSSVNEEEEEMFFENIKYNYWDTLQEVNKDFEMTDALSLNEAFEIDNRKIFEVVEPLQEYQYPEGLDIDMGDR